MVIANNASRSDIPSEPGLAKRASGLEVSPFTISDFEVTVIFDATAEGGTSVNTTDAKMKNVNHGLIEFFIVDSLL